MGSGVSERRQSGAGRPCRLPVLQSGRHEVRLNPANGNYLKGFQIHNIYL